MIEEQKNNPLHGIKLEALLTDLVDHYGWEVLADEININCFKSNPSIKSSLKFLRKTAWAREKVEGFYLYKFKRLPKPDDRNYELPPRDRIVPMSQQPRSPAVIDAKPKAAKSDSQPRAAKPAPSGSKENAKKPENDVWAKWRK
jgi:uncharacterized protein (DUF2132 family)